MEVKAEFEVTIGMIQFTIVPVVQENLAARFMSRIGTDGGEQQLPRHQTTPLDQIRNFEVGLRTSLCVKKNESPVQRTSSCQSLEFIGANKYLSLDSISECMLGVRVISPSILDLQSSNPNKGVKRARASSSGYIVLHDFLYLCPPRSRSCSRSLESKSTSDIVSLEVMKWFSKKGKCTKGNVGTRRKLGEKAPVAVEQECALAVHNDELDFWVFSEKSRS
ncbi:hypothetical protein PM082_024351 [Marasmius tenuissimus]|nr:hypothetical protein PM082_024351 [Marasmius tenuissimus]